VCQTKSIRRLYCPECRKYRHRDVLAGHNICNILKSFVEQQERPLYLQPVDEDGGYPWMDKDGKNKDEQFKSAPSPSKRASPGRSRKRQVEEYDNEKADAKRQATKRAKGKRAMSKTAMSCS